MAICLKKLINGELEMKSSMNKVTVRIMALATLTILPVFAQPALADNLQAFTTDTFADIKAEYAGKPFFVSLWSVDCPPCRVELDMLGELVAEQPDLALVLISTDQLAERDYANEVLEDAGLDGIASWMFADSFAERLRYTIDPYWFGELPRSYYYDADHNSRSHSGIMTRDMLSDFIDH